jgi:4'-phosphopantetheinyl transferase EntD
MDNDCGAQPGVLPPLEDECVKYVALSATPAVRHILHPDEVRDAATVKHPSRKEEFLLGRAASHQALLRLGIERTIAIRKGSFGEPLWPEGFVGSITHCQPWTVAAVARQEQVLAIGIDLVSMERIRVEDVRGVICRPPELDWIANGNPVERLTIMFAVKEAIFKAAHPSCHRFFDFLDVELVSDPSANRCAGTLQVDLSERYAKGYRFLVRYSLKGEYVFAYLVDKVL